MKINEGQLHEILLRSGFVTKEEYEEAIKIAHDLEKPVVDILIERGIILEKFLGQLLAESLDFPYADLRSEQISSEILKLIPEITANEKRVVPFKKEALTLHLAMENPNDLETIEFVKKKTDLEVIPYFTLPTVLDLGLNLYRQNFEQDFEKVINQNVSNIKLPSGDESKIIKTLDTILSYAASEGASDLHVESSGNKVIIRFRIDGKLRDVLALPQDIRDGLITRIKILSNLRTDEHRLPQDGRFRFKHRNDEISIRVSILPTYRGEDAVLRLLSSQARPKTLEDLGLAGKNLKVVKEAIKLPHGMILSCGPTGSGKTTTLYNILSILNISLVNICTIEDPIEYGLPRVNQIQVNPEVGLTFATGLRSVLRHDPNIILVGEIRDQETAEISIHAALTGHLVLSSLHTNDAIGAIPRLIDLGAQTYLIGSTLNLVIAQRLVAKICPECIQTLNLDSKLLETLKSSFGEDLPPSFKKKNATIHKGKGCENCNLTGFQHRIGIFEVLKISDSIRELIFKQAPTKEIEGLAKKEGFKSMIFDGLAKVEAGLTTVEEVMEAVRK